MSPSAPWPQSIQPRQLNGWYSGWNGTSGAAPRNRSQRRPLGTSALHLIGERVGEALIHAVVAPVERLPVAVEFLRVRHALRPVRQRPVGPDVHLFDLAEDPGCQIVLAAPRIVGRVALVAHLRDQLGIRRRLRREVPRFRDRPAHRLLHVHVLAGGHRGRRDRRVHVIRRRDDHRIDVFLTREHLAVVAMAFDARELGLDEAPEAGVCRLELPALIGSDLESRWTPHLEWKGGRPRSRRSRRRPRSR